MSKTTIFFIIAALLVAGFFFWKMTKKPIPPAATALGSGGGSVIPGLPKVQVAGRITVFGELNEITGQGSNIIINNSDEFVGSLLGTKKREFNAGGKVWIELYNPSGQQYQVNGQLVKRFVERTSNIVIL